MKSALTLAVTFLLAACASVPPEAVELSQVAGRRVADAQASHEALAAAYFDLSRQRIEDFIDQRWTPRFLATFVADANLMDDLAAPVALTDSQQARLVAELTRQASLRGDTLDRAVRAVNSALGDTERGQMILEFAEAALTEIRRQRSALLAPINAQEREVTAALRANYAEMMEIQSAITAYLRSVSEVKAEEDAVLRRLDLLRARDAIVRDAIALNESVVQVTNDVEDAEEALRRIRELLGASAPPGDDRR